MQLQLYATHAEASCEVVICMA